MRKLVALFSIALFLSGCACHNYGLKSGLNIASLNGDEDENLDSRVAWFFGGFAELCITDTWAVQPELLYSAQGADYSESEGYDGKFKLDYINVPVMLKHKIGENFAIEAGPQFGLLVSAKDEYESPGDSGEDDIKDEVKSFDFGANLGVSYQLDGGLNFGARYNLGLTEIPDESNWNIKNGVFQFSVGYRF